MNYTMHLHSLPFNQIKGGFKTIEARLNDEKRQTLKVGDVIVFTKRPENLETIKVKIIKLSKFSSFEELFNSKPASQFGGDSLKDLLESIHKYYSREDEQKYGVVGIEVSLILD